MISREIKKSGSKSVNYLLILFRILFAFSRLLKDSSANTESNILIAIAKVLLLKLSVNFAICSLELAAKSSAAFLIAPMINASCVTLDNSQMTNASGLQSLARNIGGAMGTSISATAISRFSQIHQNYLVENLSQFNNVYLVKIGALTQNFSQYTDQFLANHMGNTMLYNILLQQSILKAFVSVFEFCALASFIIIPLIFFISDKKQSD